MNFDKDIDIIMNYHKHIIQRISKQNKQNEVRTDRQMFGIVINCKSVNVTEDIVNTTRKYIREVLKQEDKQVRCRHGNMREQVRRGACLGTTHAIFDCFDEGCVQVLLVTKDNVNPWGSNKSRLQNLTNTGKIIVCLIDGFEPTGLIAKMRRLIGLESLQVNGLHSVDSSRVLTTSKSAVTDMQLR